MCGNHASPAREVFTPSQALLRLLENCGVLSLATIYYHLREGIENPDVRELTDETVKTSLMQIAQILKAVEATVEEADRNHAG